MMRAILFGFFSAQVDKNHWYSQQTNKNLLISGLVTWMLLATVNPAFCDELVIGTKAPNLIGNDALSGDRLNLYLLLTTLQFKRDERGFLIVGSDGKYVNEFVRNVVVLNFFSRTCIPCIREIPAYNRLAEKYRNQPVRFLYINVDPELTPEDAKRFIETYQIEIAMMLCNQAEAIRKYDASALPRLIVIDQQKVIAHIIQGFDENLEAILSQMIDTLLQNPIEP